MSKIINISLDLNKIDKTKIVNHANGAKYLNLVVDELPNTDQFGNTHSVYHQQSKEERTAKVKRVYLGNGKLFDFSNRSQQPAPKTPLAQNVNAKDDLPF